MVIHMVWRGAAHVRHLSSVVAHRTVVLSNGVVGAEKQAVALAEAVGLPYSVATCGPTSLLSRLPTRLQLLLPIISRSTHTPPHPALAISCGRGTTREPFAVPGGGGGALAREQEREVQRVPVLI